MVNSEIPEKYTLSPPTLSGTPQYTINHGATLDLDSSNAFEGPEKLLEVWFAPSADAIPASVVQHGLKSVSKATWTEMLDMVHCQVLSVIEYDDMDAYLLSESSMFVYPHKVVLKTCGTTTLLHGLPKMLEIAANEGGFPEAWPSVNGGPKKGAGTYRVFYSRKNFLFPAQQKGAHRSWRDEVRALDKLFCGGSAYLIGKMNGDHWYLYITEPDRSLTPPRTPKGINGSEEPNALATSNGFSLNSGLLTEISDVMDDETLEILMTDLDQDNAKQFVAEHASTMAETTHVEFDESFAKSMDQHDDAEVDVFGTLGLASDESPSGHMAGSTPEKLVSEGHRLGSVISNACGLSDVYPKSVYPEARIDAYLFDPCGFSANGVIPAGQPVNGDYTNGTSANGNHVNGNSPVADKDHHDGASTHYFTVHVTPEPQCSYASFETNVPARQSGKQTAEVVEHVVNIFRPARFSVTLFEAKPSCAGAAGREVAKRTSTSRMDAIKGYRRMDRIVHDLDGYDLVFRYFERHDFQGGAPRLGEVF